MRQSVLSLMLIWSAALYAAEGVEVTATIDRNQIGLGDVVHLVVSVSSKDSSNVGDPKIGGLPGFEVINSSTGYETRSSYDNGRFVTSQSRTFTYMLAAARKGAMTIPEIAVDVDGQTYRTKPIHVTVSDARKNPVARGGGRGQGQPDPFQQMDDMEELFQQMLQRRMGGGAGGGMAMDGAPVNPNEAFFIQADVDKKKAFVGEQITANFYLVTRGQIRDIDTLKYPDLKGFWKEDLEMATRLNFENVVIEGVPYQRALLVSYALFPIKPGKAVIDTYKAKCTVLTPSNLGFGRPYQFTKASRPIDIEVQDVPANRPHNYTGAVGSFRVTAQFEPPTGVVNQPITLRVRFDGQGNAKLIELPNLQLPPSFELYDQKSQAKFLKDGTSFKEFEVLIIPREPGVFKIPAVTIATFDPRAQKFTEVSSQPLDLSVSGTATTAAPAQAQTVPGDKGPVAPSEPQLPSLATEIGSRPTSAGAQIAITAAMYCFAFGFLGIYGWRKLRHKPKKLSLKLVLKRRMGTVRSLVAAKDWRKVGVELTNTAYYILGQLSEQGGANQELNRLLEHTPPSLRNELATPIQKLLAQCEALSFAPETLIVDMTEKTKMDKLIQEFDKVMSRAIELAEI
ncbi:MAG: protein BatD [Bdellovibrionales bacterium]|nr:protein BatD [Bdellovibrionales bacterium]